MLEKERFLALKKLARDIREDNKKTFKAFKKLSFDEAVEQKNEFIKEVLNNMDIAFSEGEQGREEKQMFRANILIPNDDEFLETYSKDKNIRNLMNKYGVSIEDIMSKITELNIYGKYIEEGSEKEIFTNEEVSISPKEAESLLDEIDNLSVVMEDLDLSSVELKPELLKPETVDLPKEVVVEDSKEETEDFDDITNAISDFVGKYDQMQNTIDAKDEKIRNLQAEIEKLDKINSEASANKENVEKELSNLRSENERLQKANEKLETKLNKALEVLNKIYKSISKK